MSPAGWVHAIYAWVQAVLVLLFVFFSTNIFLDYFALFWFFVYTSLIPYGSMKLHGKFINADKVLFYGALLVFMIKLISVIF